MLRKKEKKAQLFHTPFVIIFSIFLIVIFIVVAFFAISKFLEIKKCTEINLFVEDMQEKLDKMWLSGEGEHVFSNNLPSGIKHVCFIDFSLPIRGIYAELYEKGEFSRYSHFEPNLIFSPSEKACDLPYRKIKHVNLTLEIKNPYCFENKGKIEIEMKKGFNDNFAKIL